MTDLRELLRPRVERGAALLDSVEPYWFKLVEVALDLSDCKRCVLGQVFGDYDDGLDLLNISNDLLPAWRWAADHGFERPLDVPFGPAYRTLDDLWLEAIAERRSR